MPKIDGGLLSCWRHTARSKAPSRRGRNHAKMIFLVGENEEEDEKRKDGRNAPTKGESDDQKCGRQ